MARSLALLFLLLSCGEFAIRWLFGTSGSSSEWALVSAGGLIWLEGHGDRVGSSSPGLPWKSLVAAATVLVAYLAANKEAPASLLFSSLLWLTVLFAALLTRDRTAKDGRDLRVVLLAGLLSIAGLLGAVLQVRGSSTEDRSNAVTPDPDNAPSSVLDMLWLGQAEDLVIRASGGEMTRQRMSEFGGDWAGGIQAFMATSEPSAQVSLNLPIPNSVDGRLLLRLTSAPDYGRVAIETSGTRRPLLVDTYSPQVRLMPWIEVASGTIEPGEVLVRNVGRSDSSLGFQFGIDAIAIAPLSTP